MSKPVARVKCGYVSAAIFENESNGKKYLSYSFQKSYKDKDGKWSNSDSFSEMDIPSMATLLNRIAIDCCRIQSTETQQLRPDAFSLMPDGKDIPF